MKIYILDKVLEYENNKNNVENIFNEIEDILSKASETVEYMIIDNVQIYEDFYNYFSDKINEIEKVEIVTITYKQLVNDVLGSTLNYLEKGLPIIKGLGNGFYNTPTKESWQDLNDLLGGISWIMNTFSLIDQNSKIKDIVLNYENWNLYAKEVFLLKEILIDFESALSNEDMITVGDILLYEISPIFSRMIDLLLTLVDNKDILDELN